MDRASISQGNRVLWFRRSFALKNHATLSVSLQVKYSVAPRPGTLTAPSVTIHSWSAGRGSDTALAEDNVFWATVKALCRSSDHATISFDIRPATASSSGASTTEQPLIAQASTLNAPINERKPITVLGWEHAARADTR